MSVHIGKNSIHSVGYYLWFPVSPGDKGRLLYSIAFKQMWKKGPYLRVLAPVFQADPCPQKALSQRLPQWTSDMRGQSRPANQCFKGCGFNCFPFTLHMFWKWGYLSLGQFSHREQHSLAVIQLAYEEEITYLNIYLHIWWINIHFIYIYTLLVDKFCKPGQLFYQSSPHGLIWWQWCIWEQSVLKIWKIIQKHECGINFNMYENDCPWVLDVS